MNGELNERLAALAAATELADGRAPEPAVVAARQLVERATQRLAHGTDRTVVALAGPTGSGKSQLFNRLAGAELSPVGVRRPTTSDAQAAVWGPAADRLLDWLEVPDRAPAAAAGPEGLVLLDLPDVDSVAQANHWEANRLIDSVDALIWVLDPQKYADEVLHRGQLADLAHHADVISFVISKADLLTDTEQARIVEDLGRRLEPLGLGSCPIVTSGSDDIEAVRGLIEGLVDQRRAALARLEADLMSASVPLRPGAGVAAPLDEEQLVDELARAATAELVASAVADDHRRSGVRATGWAPLSLVRRRRSTASRQLVDSGPVDALGVEAAVRSATEQVGAGLDPRWAAELRHRLLDDIEPTVEELDRCRRTIVAARAPRPAWWSGVGLIQRLVALVALVGLVWLLALAATGLFVPGLELPLPELGPLPLPTVLLAGGVLVGLVLSRLLRPLVEASARRQAGRVRAEFTERVAAVAEQQVRHPIEGLLGERAELDALLDQVAGTELSAGRPAGSG